MHNHLLMNKLILPLFLLAIIGISCTPKAKEVITDNEETVVEEVMEKPFEEYNDCITFKDQSAAERSEARRAYTIYRTLVKQGAYDDALPHWQKAMAMAPGANGQVKYHFSDGVKIYKHKFEQATTDTQKQKMLDSINIIYDLRVTCHPEDQGYVAGRKAYDYYYDFSEFVSNDAIFEMFKNSIDIQQEKTNYFIINPFTEMLYNKIVDKSISNAEGLKYIKLIQKAMDYGIKNCEEKVCAGWEEVEAYTPDLLESLEGVDGLYDCAYYADKYYAYYTTDPNNCEYIAIAYGNMLRGSCNATDPRFTEVKNAYVKLCQKPNVVAQPTIKKTKTKRNTIVQEAYQLYKAKQFQQAVDKYDEYLQTITDPVKASKYNMKIARIYYRDIKNYPKSRKYALQAAKLRPNWGEPYLEIGKLYASSGKLCGPGRGFDSQVVTWPAIDMFKKAKRVDPSVTQEANKWISRYAKFMPKKGDIFLRRIEEGSTFRVECWIQRNTIVRTVD